MTVHKTRKMFSSPATQLPAMKKPKVLYEKTDNVCFRGNEIWRKI